MTQRVWNFSAGPGVLPLPVLEEAQRDLLCLPGVGASVLEISHRSKHFDAIIQEAEANLRQLLNIPDHYHVLFLQGGASLQFAMVAMNLLGDGSADYILTGSWGEKALKEAQLVGKQIPVLVNLQPALIRGIVSEGMMLAADVDGRAVLLHPDREVPSGSTVR